MTAQTLRRINSLPATQKFLNKPYNSEAELQSAAFIWINATFPPIRHFFFHVPNEQATSDLMRLKMASFGVLSGVPDFCFILPTFWALELKHGNNGLSPKQKALHTLWQQHGIDVFVAHSAHQVVSAVSHKLAPILHTTQTTEL